MGVKVLGYIAIALSSLAIGMVSSFLATGGYVRGFAAGDNAGYKVGFTNGHNAACNDLTNWARWAANYKASQVTSRHYDDATGLEISSTIDAASNYVCQTSGPHLANNPYEPPAKPSP